jgi:hypothetical protein
MLYMHKSYQFDDQAFQIDDNSWPLVRQQLQTCLQILHSSSNTLVIIILVVLSLDVGSV